MRTGGGLDPGRSGGKYRKKSSPKPKHSSKKSLPKGIPVSATSSGVKIDSDEPLKKSKPNSEVTSSESKIDCIADDSVLGSSPRKPNSLPLDSADCKSETSSAFAEQHGLGDNELTSCLPSKHSAGHDEGVDSEEGGLMVDDRAMATTPVNAGLTVVDLHRGFKVGFVGNAFEASLFI